MRRLIILICSASAWSAARAQEEYGVDVVSAWGCDALRSSWFVPC